MLTRSQFSTEPVLKKEVGVNDDTGSIRLVLYAEHAKLHQNDTYEMQNMVVRHAYGKVYLTTSSSSVIKATGDKVTPSDASLRDLNLKEFKLPPSNVIVAKQFTCSHCKMDFSHETPSSGSFLKCPSCKSLAKETSYRFHYMLKLSFSGENVTIYRHQVELYFKSKETKGNSSR